MANIFSQSPVNRVKKSHFNLSHDVKASFDLGNLVPVMCAEVLPGDTMKHRLDVMIKLSPLLTPLMHEVDVKAFSFFVPTRILWNNWEQFIAGSESGNDTGLIPPRFFNVSGTPGQNNLYGSWSRGYLDIGQGNWDYLGLPPIYFSGSPRPDLSNYPSFDINALPFRALYRIIYEYFRDEYLQDTSITNDSTWQKPQKGDTVTNTEALCILRLRNINWQKDYFTACQPWPQRGPTVNIPGVGGDSSISGIIPSPLFRRTSPTSGVPASGAASFSTNGILTDNSGAPVYFDQTNTGLEAGSSEDGTLDNLRTAWSLKRWFENASRHGVRYIEHLLGHWGVRNGDARLQRPEFLCASTTPVVFSEVLQTSSSDSTSPQGNYAGHGMTVSFNHSWKRNFTEDGYVISLLAVTPRTAYTDGVHRMFTRQDRFDYAFPEFSHTSEQAVFNKEIYAPWLPNSIDPDGAFGYLPRYTEYRYIPSRIAGDFRDTLDFWHLGRKFFDYRTGSGTQPALNDSFVTSSPSSRIFAVESGVGKQLYCQVRHKLSGRRKLPKFGIPGVRC